MPGPVSDSYDGPDDDAPYVPGWMYENGPRDCACGHHEGYHDDDGHCKACGCVNGNFATTASTGEP